MISHKAWHTRCARRDLARGGLQAAPPRGRPVRALGQVFPGALTIAAGIDTDGALVGRLEGSGLGAIEIGSVRASTRAFHRARRALRRLRARPVRKTSAAARLRYGVSLAKRAQTPWSDAAAELSNGVSAFAGLADYVTLNPGPGRPALAEFIAIVAAVARHRDALVCSGSPRLPLMVKLAAPWLRGAHVLDELRGLAAAGVDGLLLSAEGMAAHEHLALLRRLRQAHGSALGLVSVGGVCAVRAALQRLDAGADLVQIHGAVRQRHRRQWIDRAVAALCGPVEALSRAASASAPRRAPRPAAPLAAGRACAGARRPRRRRTSAGPACRRAPAQSPRAARRRARGT